MHKLLVSVSCVSSPLSSKHNPRNSSHEGSDLRREEAMDNTTTDGDSHRHSEKKLQRNSNGYRDFIARRESLRHLLATAQGAYNLHQRPHKRRHVPRRRSSASLPRVRESFEADSHVPQFTGRTRHRRYAYPIYGYDLSL